jgi:predicted NAD/FAD-binding protein
MPGVLVSSSLNFNYYSDIYLHCDKTLMPRNPSAWSAWNFLGTTSSGVSVTYWLNLLQVKFTMSEMHTAIL